MNLFPSSSPVPIAVWLRWVYISCDSRHRFPHQLDGALFGCVHSGPKVWFPAVILSRSLVAWIPPVVSFPCKRPLCLTRSSTTRSTRSWRAWSVWWSGCGSRRPSRRRWRRSGSRSARTRMWQWTWRSCSPCTRPSDSGARRWSRGPRARTRTYLPKVSPLVKGPLNVTLRMILGVPWQPSCISTHWSLGKKYLTGGACLGWKGCAHQSLVTVFLCLWNQSSKYSVHHDMKPCGLQAL